MIPALSDTSLRTTRRVWAERMGTSEALWERDGVTTVRWDTVPAASVVGIAGALLVGAPPSALERIRDLDLDSLLDSGALMNALEELGPTMFGAAELAYLDAGTFRPSHSRTAVAAARDEVKRMILALPASEWEESGLEEMDRWWVVREPDGTPVAVAGCETWNGTLAHLGIAVVPIARGTGAGVAAASAAITQALDDGLIVQWRSEVRNQASRRLGARLGAVPLGRQVTVDLAM